MLQLLLCAVSAFSPTPIQYVRAPVAARAPPCIAIDAAVLALPAGAVTALALLAANSNGGGGGGGGGGASQKRQWERAAAARRAKQKSQKIRSLCDDLGLNER